MDFEFFWHFFNSGANPEFFVYFFYHGRRRWHPQKPKVLHFDALKFEIQTKYPKISVYTYYKLLKAISNSKHHLISWILHPLNLCKPQNSQIHHNITSVYSCDTSQTENRNTDINKQIFRNKIIKKILRNKKRRRRISPIFPASQTS